MFLFKFFHANWQTLQFQPHNMYFVVDETGI